MNAGWPICGSDAAQAQEWCMLELIGNAGSEEAPRFVTAYLQEGE
jgi:hypothetical protein